MFSWSRPKLVNVGIQYHTTWLHEDEDQLTVWNVSNHQIPLRTPIPDRLDRGANKMYWISLRASPLMDHTIS